jgi:hypothetical protein
LYKTVAFQILRAYNICMAQKTSYRATFADGTVITRNSDRVYTHAYRTVFGAKPVRGGISNETHVQTGFAASYEKAGKATSAYSSYSVRLNTEIVAVEIVGGAA